MTRCPTVVQQLWRWDMTSPFPPSRNGGYIRNRDVPFQSVTLYVTLEHTDELGSLKSATITAPSSTPSHLISPRLLGQKLGHGLRGESLLLLFLLTHTVRLLDNTGKAGPFQGRC